MDGVEVPVAGTYELDASHTHVGFSVRHVMVSKTKGRFAEVAGTVTIAEEPSESSVDVTIQAASVDTRDEGRDGHLRSADFLDVDQHPTLTYRSTGVRSAGKGGWVRVTAREEDRVAVIEVADSGAGVPPEIQERIFDPFFTTKPVGQGTGLGLAVSRRIALNHGGHLRVVRRERGTAFRLELPLPE